MEEQHDHPDDDDDLVARLPDDVIADVLLRLAPRWIATSRCVRKAWRTVVDTRSLLHADHLPLSLRGIFIDFGWRVFSEFFSRPASSSSSSTAGGGPAEISGKVDFLPVSSELPERSHWFYSEFVVRDHCNGLVLVSNYVVNPATQRWVPLPEPPPDNHHKEMTVLFNEYLVFDPTVSPHYEVIMVPRLPCSPCHLPTKDLDLEWPPSPLVLRVFSSRSSRWEERSFVRQGNVAATVGEFCGIWTRLFSAYWRGSLYVHSQDFFMRISLSEDKYSVIGLPVAMREDIGFTYHSSRLGRSEKGVYLASFRHHVLHVWILNESCGHLEWMLKGKYSLEPVEAFDQQVYGPWILQDSSYDMYGDHLREPTNYKRPECEEKFEWNSDDDDDEDDDFPNNVDVVDRASDDEGNPYIDILGFHPYKEIIFLSRFEEYDTMATGLAYHLNSSKVEALGSIYPTHGDRFDISLRNCNRFIFHSFPYTPCWIGELPRNSRVI